MGHNNFQRVDRSTVRRNKTRSPNFHPRGQSTQRQQWRLGWGALNRYKLARRLFQAIKQSQVERGGGRAASRRRGRKEDRLWTRLIVLTSPGCDCASPRASRVPSPINNEYMNMKISMRIQRRTSTLTGVLNTVITMGAHASRVLLPGLIDPLRSDRNMHIVHGPSKRGQLFWLCMERLKVKIVQPRDAASPASPTSCETDPAS